MRAHENIVYIQYIMFSHFFQVIVGLLLVIILVSMFSESKYREGYTSPPPTMYGIKHYRDMSYNDLKTSFQSNTTSLQSAIKNNTAVSQAVLGLLINMKNIADNSSVLYDKMPNNGQDKLSQFVVSNVESIKLLYNTFNDYNIDIKLLVSDYMGGPNTPLYANLTTALGVAPDPGS